MCSLGADFTRGFGTVASEYGVSKTEDLYAALGFGRFSARQILQKVAPDEVHGAPPLPLQQQPHPGSRSRVCRSAMAI